MVINNFKLRVRASWLEASTDTGRDDFAESSGTAVEVEVRFPLSYSRSCPKVCDWERGDTEFALLERHCQAAIEARPM
jgi:hypothetical protein